MMIDKKPREHTIGIVGGMGPAASIRLQQLILEATPATKDQEHLKVLCFSNPQIPDRTNSLAADGGASFVRTILETIRALERAGANLLAIPCHTAHVCFAEIQRGTSLPIVNLVETTLEYLSHEYPNARKVGVLATDGTVESKMFDAYAQTKNISIIYPDPPTQKTIMREIYALKTGRINQPSVESVRQAIRELTVRVDAVILGCTELSLVYEALGEMEIPTLDPLRILANELVELAAPRLCTMNPVLCFGGLRLPDQSYQDLPTESGNLPQKEDPR